MSEPNDEKLNVDDDKPVDQANDDMLGGLDPEATLTLSEAERRQLELLDANNRALRAQADLENYRKRVQREQQQESRYALMPLLRDLLPLLDNIQRAIEAAENNEGTQSLLEGFKLVAQQLESILERANIYVKVLALTVKSLQFHSYFQIQNLNLNHLFPLRGSIFTCRGLNLLAI